VHRWLRHARALAPGDEPGRCCCLTWWPLVQALAERAKVAEEKTRRSPAPFDAFSSACYDDDWLFHVPKESVVKHWTLAGNLQALGGIRLQSDDALCTRAVSAQCP